MEVTLVGLPFKEDLICYSGKWISMEKCIQDLRELALLGVMDNINLHD